MGTRDSRHLVTIETRHAIEETFHDAKAAQRLSDFYLLNPLEIADAFSVAQLGNVTGKHLLEIGCGDGRLCLQFARAGARVTGIDISLEMVELTRNAATRADVSDRVEAVRMSGEDLSLPDESVDLIYGHSILHHLNLEIAGRHLSRVLRVGGVAVFLEPLDDNPILKAFRFWTPRRRTPTERPLKFRQLESIAMHFGAWEHTEFYLVSLCAFLWYYGYRSERSFKKAMTILQPLDRMCFRRIPFLRRYAWVSVIMFKK
jgi:SAM-dependent methyltransferase